MSTGGSDGTADKPADRATEEEEGPSQAGSTMPSVELPRKRKGEVEERSNTHVQQSLNFNLENDFSRSEGEDQQVKMKCFREPHRQIEKRRRDKMNNLIDELSAMIPACQPMARKLDKLTVLRKAVQHLKALKAGGSGAFAEANHKPSILPHDDLRHLLLRTPITAIPHTDQACSDSGEEKLLFSRKKPPAEPEPGSVREAICHYRLGVREDRDTERTKITDAADGFLLVVRCDRAKILFISESVSKILNFSKFELTGQSLLDFIHPKDIHKVKEQLSSSEMLPQQRLVDASTGVQVQAEAPVRPSHLATGARRSFFCRMKHSRVAGKHEDKHTLHTSSKKKETYRYCTLHCTGYMRTWPSSQLDPEGDGADKETSSLNSLVTVCRLHPHISHQPPKDVNVKATEFVTRCAIDGKFTFVDQQATTVIGYLPQEVLGTSCYEYFHQDDLQHMAGKHRQVLRSKEKIETQCYKFKTKHGSYVTLQSQWFGFTNPWTKEVEFIVSSNRVISGPGHTKDEREAGSLKLAQEDAKEILHIPGFSTGVGTMIYAGSIGTQIANELGDTYRANSSPSSGASSPFGSVQEKCPQTSRSTSSREDEAGSSSHSQSQADSSKEAAESSAAPESRGELSQLDLDVSELSSFSNDEAAMAVIMSLLETDVNMGQTGDFEDLHWPF